MCVWCTAGNEGGRKEREGRREGKYLVEDAPPRVNILARRAPKDEDEDDEEVLVAWTLRVLCGGCAWRD